MDKLKQYIHLLKPTLELLPDVIFIKDLEFKYRLVNKAFRKLYNFDKEEIIDKTDYQAYPKETAELYRTSDINMIKSKEPIILNTKSEQNNETLYYLTIKSPIIDKDNKIIGILGTSREITKEIEYQKQIQENYVLLDTIIDNVPSPIFVKDLKGRYLNVNSAYAQIHNLSKEEIIGKTDFEFQQSDIAESIRQKDLEVINSKEKVIYLYESEFEPFKRQYVVKDIFRNYEDKIIGIIGIVNDFTDIRDFETDIIEKQKIDSIANLAGGIAHDLNNTLTAILGNADILISEETDPIKKEKLKVVENATIQASSLIKKLLAFAKRGKYKVEMIDVNKVIENVSSLLKSNISDNISLQTSLSPEIGYVEGDTSQIDQIIMNLCLNAFDSIDNNGKVSITTSKVNISDLQSSRFVIKPLNNKSRENAHSRDFVKISVSDDGKGIPKEDLGRVFEPFYTTKSTNHSGSRGLGLSIVYGVVSNHNGLLDISSEKNGGTTFDVYLPFAGVDEKIDRTDKENSNQFEKLNVLVIDDNKAILRTVEKMVKKLGHSVETANSGLDGLDKLSISPNQYDLLLLDLKMPEISGEEVFEQLKQAEYDVMVIIITGYGDDETIQHMIKLGVDDVLQKPFTLQQLENAILQLN